MKWRTGESLIIRSRPVFYSKNFAMLCCSLSVTGEQMNVRRPPSDAMAQFSGEDTLYETEEIFEIDGVMEEFIAIDKSLYVFLWPWTLP